MKDFEIEAKVIAEHVSFKGKSQAEIDTLNEESRLRNEQNGFREITEK